jgi:hypothetical protein
MSWLSYGRRDVSPITYWAHSSGRYVMGLAGSKHHLLDDLSEGATGSSSATFPILEWLLRRLGTPTEGELQGLWLASSPVVDLTRRGVESGLMDRSELEESIESARRDYRRRLAPLRDKRSWDAMYLRADELTDEQISVAVEIASGRPGPTNRFECVAKVLHRGPVGRRREGPPMRTAILATPLYVALID